jgi:type VI secretion system FHA domain protein
VLLALSVISQQSQRLGTTGYRIFDERGGSIGRGKTNDWILDDPDLVLSTRHAQIRFSGNSYAVEDLSTNGTGLNGIEALVPKGQLVPISDGDRLFLGDFEILVQVIADPPASMVPPSTRAMPEAARPFVPPPPMPPPPVAPLPTMSAPPMAPVDSYRAPPRPSTLGNLTDLVADNSAELRAHAATGAPPVVSVAPSGPIDLGALLAAAGLQPHMVRPEILQQLGEILRVVTAGLIDVLAARKEIKNQFRMTSTIMRPVENNPLKFDRSVEEAMHTLFIKCNPGWLGPREAYQEAFDDLGRHQLATLAGMQAAFAAVLKRFNPAGVEKMCERGARGGWFGWFSKPSYWGFYRAYYEKLSQDSEAAFQQLFGEAFVRAYDDQMRRLESTGSPRP